MWRSASSRFGHAKIHACGFAHICLSGKANGHRGEIVKNRQSTYVTCRKGENVEIRVVVHLGMRKSAHAIGHISVSLARRMATGAKL
jgi:hypothetical protein